jgi:eukaryotic-like serine/threonine-protein kinase
MTLTSGTKLGPYEVVAPAGAGGMGEVYRARDTRLNRDVAVKILPAAFARDPERMRRFQQEAQAVAALNHPNILAIHDFGEHEGSPYIVTEFLEGETLRVRLGLGALPVRKAIDYAEQIAYGMATAHEKGIVHRDLKPENIFVTRDGRVKILDFGLAKLMRQEGKLAADAATLASQTEPGVVMGTAGYMSPEQVKGLAADHRSDLFSFGAILYEMLSGRRAFQGDSSVEIMSAILKQEVPELTETNRTLPPTLGRIVRHCLEKNPEERFQSARDVAFALGALSDSSGAITGAVTVGARQAWRPWVRVAAEVVLLGIALNLFLTRHSEKPEHSVLGSVLPPPGDGFAANLTQPAAISPDGKFLAIIAMRNGHTQLWLRRMDALEAQPIAGSEDAGNPFWSPDSRYIGFFVPGKLKKADVSGGAVSDICAAGTFGMGGAWSSRGVIVFGTLADVLRRVPDSGGTPERIPGVDLSGDALGQYWPMFLPDGNHLIYLEWRYATFGSHDNAVWIGSMDGEKARRLPLISTNTQYAGGHLLFSQGSDLFAQRFDLARLELSGPAIPVARNIQYDTFFDIGTFTVSENGTLVYGRAGTGVDSELTWMDRSGRTISVLGDPRHFEDQSISPDGKRVAVGVKEASAREKIWIYDVDRGTRIPVVSEESGSALYRAVWSPDGTRVAYRDTVGKTSGVLVHASDGSGADEPIGAREEGVVTVQDWSPDGQRLAVTLTKFRGSQNWNDTLQVWQVSTGAKSGLEIADASGATFSPDGHWLAYSDEKSGEIYVTSFPGPGARIAVSSKGGGDPRWRGDGQELFYVTDDLTMMSVKLHESANEFRVLSSQPLFRLQLPYNVGFYDATRDGKRFLVNTRTYREQAAPLTIVTHWLAQMQSESKNELPKN